MFQTKGLPHVQLRQAFSLFRKDKPIFDVIIVPPQYQTVFLSKYNITICVVLCE